MLKKLFTKMQRQIVSFRTVLILLWGASPQAIILLILASSLTGFLTPIGLLCTQHFLDAIVRSVSAGGKFASVVIWLLLLLGVTLFGNLTSMALQTLRANFSDVLALHITQKTLAKYQVIHAEAFEKKEIYINSKIMELEESCIKYIVIHELCHLKYKTHAKSFYNLVKKYFPKYEKYDEILNGYKF